MSQETETVEEITPIGNMPANSEIDNKGSFIYEAGTTCATVDTLINNYNTIVDYIYVNGKRTTLDTAVYPAPQDSVREELSEEELNKSPMYKRMMNRFSKNYRKVSIAYLGCGYSSRNMMDKLTKNLDAIQILNSVFKVTLNNNGNTTNVHFNMERFRNRPIFCGVNVLYDPATSEGFRSTEHTSEYFNSAWKTSYNGKAYAVTKQGNKTVVLARDLTFSPDFIEAVQNSTNNPNKKCPIGESRGDLVVALINKGFSIGISSLDPKLLTSASKLSPIATRCLNAAMPDVYTSDTDSLPTCATVLMEKTHKRLNLAESAGKPTPVYTEEANNTVQVEVPQLVDITPGEEKEVDQDRVFATRTITSPSIVVAAPNIAGYELASYGAIPVCSWTYFQEKSLYAGTKAVQRLNDIYTCGPFTRIVAKDYYTSTMSNILQTYIRIKIRPEPEETITVEGTGKKFLGVTLKKPDKKKCRPIQFSYFDMKTNQETDGECIYIPQNPNNEFPPDVKLDYDYMCELVLAAYNISKNNDFSLTNLRNLLTSSNKFIVQNYVREYDSEGAINDMELYETAFVRGDASNPETIANLFENATLINRIALYCIGKKQDTDSVTPVYVRQYPAIFIENPKPMKDDYVTQLVPLYVKTSDVADYTTKGEKDKYWYINKDDLIVDKDSTAAFFNASGQTPKIETYPGQGGSGTYVYSNTGLLFRGDKKEKPGIPTSIQVIRMEDVTESGSEYTAQPVLVAPGNYITFMSTSYTKSDLEKDSRQAYIEFIKNGCVFKDEDNKEPLTGKASIPSNHVDGIDLSEYALIENISGTKPTIKTKGKKIEEDVLDTGANKQKTILIIEAVIGILVLAFLIVACIIYSKHHTKEKNIQQMLIQQQLLQSPQPIYQPQPVYQPPPPPPPPPPQPVPVQQPAPAPVQSPPPPPQPTPVQSPPPPLQPVPVQRYPQYPPPPPAYPYQPLPQYAPRYPQYPPPYGRPY